MIKQLVGLCYRFGVDEGLGLRFDNKKRDRVVNSCRVCTPNLGQTRVRVVDGNLYMKTSRMLARQGIDG